jgi:hypothetical protein
MARNFVVAACYVLAHSLLLFTHVVTLFVAVNSADQVSDTPHPPSLGAP